MRHLETWRRCRRWCVPGGDGNTLTVEVVVFYDMYALLRGRVLCCSFIQSVSQSVSGMEENDKIRARESKRKQERTNRKYKG